MEMSGDFLFIVMALRADFMKGGCLILGVMLCALVLKRNLDENDISGIGGRFE